jgi:hypothetical protein
LWYRWDVVWEVILGGGDRTWLIRPIIYVAGIVLAAVGLARYRGPDRRGPLGVTLVLGAVFAQWVILPAFYDQIGFSSYDWQVWAVTGATAGAAAIGVYLVLGVRGGAWAWPALLVIPVVAFGGFRFGYLGMLITVAFAAIIVVLGWVNRTRSPAELAWRAASRAAAIETAAGRVAAASDADLAARAAEIRRWEDAYALSHGGERPPAGFLPPVTSYSMPAAGRTNGMAIAALVTSLFVPILGVIFGHVARGQIRRTGEHGDGMALAGLIVGYVFSALGLVALILYIAVFGSFLAAVNSAAG